MSDSATVDGDVESAPKKSKLPLLVGLVLALALAGGGFFAVYSGLILAPDPAQDMAMEKDSKEEREPLPDVAFVPIPPLVINLGQASSNRHLKFQAQLEVVPDAETEITRLLPRITDVLNGYLRAVSVQELEEPSALFRFRSQMLRRVQIVTGEGRVRDLLIMEFVLN